MAKDKHAYGFIGLGQMGGPMAANIAAAGHQLICFDKAGTQAMLAKERDAKVIVADSLEQVAAQAETIFLSLPDGKISHTVCEQIAAAPNRIASLVIDLSTVGPQSARSTHALLAESGVQYADGPVSGGRGGAIAATISLMWGGPAEHFERHQKTFESFTGNAFNVGSEPGQGQALKLLNNFLSATAMAATAEAMHFGISQGLDMKTMLDVVNVSSGQNMATKDKFLKRVLPGTYDAGFTTGLMTKDVKLFMQHVTDAKTASTVGTTISKVWEAFEKEYGPAADFSLIHKYAANKS